MKKNRHRQKPIFSSLNEMEIALSEEIMCCKSIVSQDIPSPISKDDGVDKESEGTAAIVDPLVTSAAPTTMRIAADGCPECQKGKIERLRRKYWMRMVPQSKLYRCDACQTRFLTVGRWILLLASKDK